MITPDRQELVDRLRALTLQIENGGDPMSVVMIHEGNDMTVLVSGAQESASHWGCFVRAVVTLQSVAASQADGAQDESPGSVH